MGAIQSAVLNMLGSAQAATGIKAIADKTKEISETTKETGKDVKENSEDLKSTKATLVGQSVSPALYSFNSSASKNISSTLMEDTYNELMKSIHLKDVNKAAADQATVQANQKRTESQAQTNLLKSTYSMLKGDLSAEDFLYTGGNK